jgi:hypothetical protein
MEIYIILRVLGFRVYPSKENGQLKRKKKDKGLPEECLDQKILSPADDLSWVMCFVYG